VRLLGHGTTVATNALIMGRLARVVLVTTEGFRDVLAIRPPGTIVRVETAGGGGFGDPGGRPGARQADDLADGLLSRREEP
jgi:N-methylhydantoinase B/oxoprolinase/acetone carboxylase alpha subunit